MMKKLFFSLVLCFGIAGMMCEDVRGMEDVKSLVSDLAKDPTNEAKLTELVENLVDKNKGFDNSIDASDYIKNIHVTLPQKDGFNKLSCMVSAILSDWIRNANSVRFVQYYVQGALSGTFGPFFLAGDDSIF